ncbi:hypothetical protein Cgig2_025416 [Carnegiea gigantea]|uniref:Protein kinase domain-containing protein n=1 Tax=Carnegiea gigantea TaxID=171969 RepID=A0A9Q1QAN0_9CARY|nr:hypothetical protein Cgig2_025416 [Carnegiea gigantea]
MGLCFWVFEKSWRMLFLIQWLMISSYNVASQRVGGRGWDGVAITEADFQGLQAFKNELIDPKGYLGSWNDSGIGACSGGWIGIKCAKGQVIAIQLPWKGLEGRITAKISQLQALRKLNLHDNGIGGSIPSSLGLLPNIRGVHLFNNRLSGSIPPSLGLCPSLQNLDLSNNHLSGFIPPTLGNSSKLYKINLSHNSLFGSVPNEIAQLSGLAFLAFQYNNLSGSLPFDFGRLSRLRTLDLSHNFINGTLPRSVSNLSSLSTMNLEGNNLVGQLPEDIGKLHNLSVLNLKRNRLDGLIPRSIGSLSNLKELDFSFNNFIGEIPDSLSDLHVLRYFNVSYNHLFGLVPVKLSKKFNSSSFIGNIELCGFSPSTPCLSQVSPPSQLPQEPISNKHRKGRTKLGVKDIILIAAGALLLVMLILICTLLSCLIRKRAAAKEEGPTTTSGRDPPERAEKRAQQAGGQVEVGEEGGKLVHFDGPMVFRADDLLCATAEVMGKSTYGTFYKATMEDGNQVAVKRLREKIAKGHKEFEVEVNLLGRIRHPNLLALRAYYLGPKGEKLLVFDYMPKGSLATFLHARGPNTQVTWTTRMRIMRGITRGLFHLHNNLNIIHGNLSSTNILIDNNNNNARISDYGISRLITSSASVTIAPMGAPGYRAPELAKLKRPNTKTDIYSLGVIMLELLTGKSPGDATNGEDLPRWVASVVKEEWTNEVFDLELMRDASTIGDELLNTLKVALYCVDPLPSIRPEVQLVLQQLEAIRAPDSATSSSEYGED